MKISLIVAMDRNRVIGTDNRLPWHLPADLKHFRALTIGKPVLMGRKTYQSIGKPLAKRENIVLSRQLDFVAPGCQVVRSIEEAMALVRTQGAEELMVIGGAQLYVAMLPLADRLYITEIDTAVAGDARFPPIDPSQWHEIARQQHPADAHNPYNYNFLTLEKIENAKPCSQPPE